MADMDAALRLLVKQDRGRALDAINTRVLVALDGKVRDVKCPAQHMCLHTVFRSFPPSTSKQP